MTHWLDVSTADSNDLCSFISKTNAFRSICLLLHPRTFCLSAFQELILNNFIIYTLWFSLEQEKFICTRDFVITSPETENNITIHSKWLQFPLQ